MLAKMIDKIVSLKETKIFEVDGHTYADKELSLVEYRLSPARVNFSSLDAICKMVRREIKELGNLGKTLFICVDRYNEVSVYTTYDESFRRMFLYVSKADAPGLTEGWRSIDKALIELRSLCIQTDGSTKLVDTLSHINFDEGMEIRDNGICQEVKVKSGVSLNYMAKVEPRVELQPFRTFLEVEQPSSEFIVRVDKSKGVGFFEADGGIWKLEAKKNIANYFKTYLSDMIERGEVVVIQ